MKHNDKSHVRDKAEVLPPGAVVNVTKQLQKYRVRQHELEQQIQELQNANKGLEASRDKYAQLYDFAPVGYFTFYCAGAVIQTVNLTGANLLGTNARYLQTYILNKLSPASLADIFTDFLRTVFQGQDKITWE